MYIYMVNIFLEIFLQENYKAIIVSPPLLVWCHFQNE